VILESKPADKVGLYLRLSRDDGEKDESDSIHSQRSLLMDFISRHRSFRYKREYVDDGYSGTNYDRPGFIQMMEEAQNGIINCVMVKDLSRLGRNYIETGKYLERIFPMIGLRLIAVNDNYDTLDKDSSDSEIVVPFKNLINDAYCRDISLKIRSHLDVKRKNGQFIGSFAVFGYEKDSNNKNHLVIDEDAARTVELVFELRLNGLSAQRIADKLNELGFQPPYEYKRKHGLNYNSGFKSAGKAVWTRETVTRILNSEIYTGTMIQGKTKRVNYKVKKAFPVEPENWIKVENTHVPIISKETFDLVQTVGALDTRVPPGRDSVYPLCGYLKCGCCGQNMVRRTTTRCGKKYHYYQCSTYKAGGNCTAHLINSEQVEGIVLKALQHQIELLEKAEYMVSYITQNKSDRSGLHLVGRQIEQLKAEIEHYGNMKAKLYGDMIGGLITREEFSEINGRFDDSRRKVTETLLALEHKEQTLLRDHLRFQPWVENLKKSKNLSSLPRSVVISSIDRVIVNSTNNVEVHFKFEDEMAGIIQLLLTEEGTDDCSELYQKTN
jgi:DNA invertase Pin-like site-specific DNA recombinase